MHVSTVPRPTAGAAGHVVNAAKRFPAGNHSGLDPSERMFSEEASIPVSTRRTETRPSISCVPLLCSPGV